MSDLSVAISKTGLVGVESEKAQTEAVNKNEPVTATPIVEVVEKEATEKKESTHEEVEVALVEVNAFVQSMQRNLSFSVDEQLGEKIISVKDSESDEVIRQIPSEEFIRVAEKISDLSDQVSAAQGLLFESKV